MRPMNHRVAAIDCGTNSIRLLVADLTVTPAGPILVDVHREMRVVRLGEGVDATGRLAGSALDRTWRAAADFAGIIRASGADAVRMVATSATRDAANRGEFTDMIERTLHISPEVISGEEEAALSFQGAVGDLPPTDGPFFIVDVGGGSTELVVGARSIAGHDESSTAGLPLGPGKITGSRSLILGCVRITERILRSDPPTRPEIDAAQQWANDVVREGLRGLPVQTVRTMVAVSGTATTIAAAALRLPVYDPAKIHLSRVDVTQARRISQFLLGATRAHRAVLGYMHPGRVDVIGGGSLILATVAEMVAFHSRITDFVVSEHDILDGIALSLA
jgi:exopolyphosphatase/guanosine-5'-triphosphate,3'-diphosphate pyrophosphatase